MAVQLGASAVAARAHEEVFTYWSSLRREGRPSRVSTMSQRLPSLRRDLPQSDG